ncbi:MAG: hypothetical protein FD138_2282 [Planctomycetota bacterium]|nr:MAG: hypothetical protein FD138_2282 [Planctomycetota bacterium]
MKSVSFADDVTNSSVFTIPVHSTGSVSGSVVKVRTSACSSNLRASAAPGKPLVFGMFAGFRGSARNETLASASAGSDVFSLPPSRKKYDVGVEEIGQSLVSRQMLPGACSSPTAPIA